MGQSTDAILFYGYLLEQGDRDDPEGFVLQWMDERSDELEAIEKEYGVHFGTHGSAEVPMPYIAIDTCHWTAHRGHPVPIAPETLPTKPDPDWRVRLVAALMPMGIVITSSPSWFLASDWS